MKTPITLRYVTQEADLPAVKAIFLEYIASLGFDISTFQDTDKEFSNLLGLYGAPHGCILLAETPAAAVAGCVALKPIGEGVCEMKRLYVRPEYRGEQIAYELTNELLRFARTAGYRSMKLDTLDTMTSAIKLYEGVGFVRCEPYVFNPFPNALFFEFVLC